jgi:hypothetical protein
MQIWDWGKVFFANVEMKEEIKWNQFEYSACPAYYSVRMSENK